MMKRAFYSGILLLILAAGCKETCNDCAEVTTKDIEVLNDQGKNLVFGSNPIYNPDSVKLFNAAGQSVLLMQKPTPGFLEFILDGQSNHYLLKTGTITDTIRFDLAFRKSTRCCGDVSYSSATYLNGQTLVNSDTIMIIRHF